MSKTTLKDLTLKEHDLTTRVKNLRDAYFRAMPEVCVERPLLLTRYHLENGLFTRPEITELDKARCYRFILEQKAPVVWHGDAYDQSSKEFRVKDESLLAGSTTSRFKGVPLYPEMMALALWPELGTITGRKKNPYRLDKKDAERLNLEVYPHWMDRSVLEHAKYRFGHPSKGGPGPNFKLLEQLVFFLASKPNCISHTVPDFKRAVNEGLDAVIRDARERGVKGSDRSRIFYLAVEEALSGIIAYSENLARRAEEMAAAEPDPHRKSQLAELARIHKKVPRHRAESFREAITTVWICWVAVHMENANVGLSLGRLDQLLFPFFEKDMAQDELTIDEALELVCCLWLKIGDHVPTVPEAGEQLFGGTGSNQAITIGGVDREGNDAVNDLTYVMLRATELMMLRDPNLNARYFHGINPKEYLERICRANMNTGATPAIHNDKAAIEALTTKGDPIEDARDFAVVGCVEPCSNGRHYGHSGALLINLTSALELMLFNGRHRHTGDRLISFETGDPAGFESYEQLQEAFRKQAEWLGEAAVGVNNALGRAYQEICPTPILSSLFEGPMDKGCDLIRGGARINSSGVAIIGFADIVDSLSAIEKLVYQEKRTTMADLISAIKSNFENDQALHAMLINPEKTPKYGNEDPTADSNAKWLVETLDRFFDSKENYRNGRYRVGYWTMTNHAGFGRLMRATPNGRKDHENFASGITPVSRETPQLTPALNSVGSLPPKHLANGVALNIKYTPHKKMEEEADEMVKLFAASVEGYFSNAGGLEIQFNITTDETFRDAIKNPKEHNELLVRVSGYTAYFKDLTPQMQKEIVERTEYELKTGEMQNFPPLDL